MKKYHITIRVLRSFMITVGLCLPVIAAVAQQQSDKPFTLQQAIDYAISHQVEVKNAELETDISQARANELIGIGLPQIEAKGNLNYFVEIPTSFVPGEFFGGEAGTYAPVKFGQPYTADAGLSASQLLFDGTYLIGLKASKTYVELRRKNLQQTKIETAVNVSKAYYYVLVAEERMKQLNSDLTRLGKLKDDTKAMYDNGFVEKIDYDRIELNYNLVESSLAQTKRLVANSYNLLKFQMGMDLKENISLAEDISQVQLDSSLIPTDSVKVESRIEYEILRTQYELTDLDLRRYKASRWPNLIAFGSYTTNASRTEFNFFEPGYKWYPTAVIGASLSIPIFKGLTISNQIEQAKLRKQKVENSFFLLDQGIIMEHQNAVNVLRSNIEKLETQSKNRNLARDISRVSKIKYDQGVGSNLEVIDAENSLREAETNYYLVLLETIISKIDLDKAAGNYKY